MKKTHIVALLSFLIQSIGGTAQNVGINSTGAAPVTSAALDIDMSDKGLLIPRVALTSTTVFAPVTGTPTTSLLVYNTATAGTSPTNVIPGFYYWDNTTSAWIAFSGVTGSNDWKIDGNSGTVNGTHFVGTIDNQALDIRTNNIIRARLTTAGQIEILNNGESVFIGQSAGITDDLTTNKNVAIGAFSLMSNVTGVGNVGIGHSTLRNTAVNSNTAVGYQSMYSNTTGYWNTALGQNSLKVNTTGYYNVALGGQALLNNTTGFENIAIGMNAMFNASTGSYNVAIGKHALLNNGASSNNTAVGFYSMELNTSGTQNTAFGDNSLRNSTSGSNNTALGYQSLYSSTTASDNVAVGYRALYSNTTASRNTGIGFYALYTNATGTNNTAVGYNALKFSTGNQNTAVGASALSSLTTGASSSAFGFEALLNTTTAHNNHAFGYQALRLNTTGENNTAIGFRSLTYNTIGSNSVAVGHEVLYNSNAEQNTAMGYRAGTATTTGGYNVFIGAYAGTSNVTGTNNLYLGNNAGANSTGSNNVFIGYGAGENELGNNKLYVDNSNTTAPLIYGDFFSNLLRVNGTLNINNAYSLPTTDGTANYILQTNGAGITSWANPGALNINESDPQVSSTTPNIVPTWNGTALVDGIIYDNGTNVGVGTTVPVSNFQTSGSVGSKIDVYSASVNLTNEHYVFFTGGTGETFTFPSASTCSGRVYIIVNHGTDILNTSTYIDGNSSSNNTVLVNETVQVISDGSNWRKINP